MHSPTRSQNKSEEPQDHVVVMQLDEQFIRQVSDDSRPANQVLVEQKVNQEAEQPAALFIP